MRDTRWRKAWRDVWLHKARTALVALAIAAALTGAGTVLNAWALVERATRVGFLASNPVAATVRSDSLDPTVLRAVRAVPGVRDAEARRSLSLAIQVRGTWHQGLLFVVEDPAEARIGRLSLDAGAWPTASGTFAIERSSMEFTGAGIGDSVVVLFGTGEPRALHVVGAVRDVGLAPGWMEHVVYGFVTPATMAALGRGALPGELRLTVNDSRATQDDVRRITAQVSDVLERSGRRVADTDVPVPGEHIHAAQMDSLLFTQGAFGMLALLTCAFLVVNLVTAMLAGQAREIGVMKTLGASPRQLGTMYLAGAAALGVLALTVSLPVAWTAGRMYGQVKADLLNFRVDGVAIPAWAVALQVIVGVLVPVLAAALPVRRATRATVAEALRDVGIGGGDARGAEPWLSRRGGLSRVLLLSIRNAFRRRERMVLTMLALASGGAVFLGARNLRASVIGSMDVLFGAQRFDFSLGLASPQAAAVVEEMVRGVPGVVAAEGWAGTRAVRHRTDGTNGNAFSLTALPARSLLYRPSLVAGRWLAPTDTNTIVVGRALLRQDADLEPGAHVELDVAGRRSRWLVVGVVDGGPSPSAWTSLSTLARVTGDSGVTAVVVDTPVEGLATQVDLIQRTRAALGSGGVAVASSQRLAESRRVTEDHLLMVVDFLAAMGWLMVAVGGMGLASTMGLAVLERTREIGVMRAIGARHRSILLLIEVEGLVIALLAWAVALPVSVPMSAALGMAFGRIMFRVPLTLFPEWRGALAWLALAVGVSLLASAWPALRATRRTIAAALAYE